MVRSGDTVYPPSMLNLTLRQEPQESETDQVLTVGRRTGFLQH